VASLLLQYGPDAEVLAPDDLRDAVVRRLQETVDA
jgi:predicted DNA-binding transcriptional regulator YafY